MDHLTRKPTSNELSKEKSNPWIEENLFMDEVALVINGFAKRCTICHRPARLKYLDKNQRCPDCREV